LREAVDLAILGEEHGAGAGGALIESEDVFHWGLLTGDGDGAMSIETRVSREGCGG
jgi:hypothetical protein